MALLKLRCWAAKAMAPRELKWFINNGCCCWLAIVLTALENGFKVGCFEDTGLLGMLLTLLVTDLGELNLESVVTDTGVMEACGELFPVLLLVSTVLTVTVVPAGMFFVNVSALLLELLNEVVKLGEVLLFAVDDVLSRLLL